MSDVTPLIKCVQLQDAARRRVVQAFAHLVVLDQAGNVRSMNYEPLHYMEMTVQIHTPVTLLPA
jgi:hypothetical protein